MSSYSIKIEDSGFGREIIAQSTNEGDAARAFLLVPGLFALWCGIRLLMGFFVEVAQKPPDSIGVILFLSIWSLLFILLYPLVTLSFIGPGIVGLLGSCRKAVFQGDKLILTHTLGRRKILYKARPKTYELRQIQDMRIQEHTYKSRHGSRRTEYNIIFDYAGIEKDLLRGLTKDQAEMLLNGTLREFCAPDKHVP